MRIYECLPFLCWIVRIDIIKIRVTYCSLSELQLGVIWFWQFDSRYFVYELKSLPWEFWYNNKPAIWLLSVLSVISNHARLYNSIQFYSHIYTPSGLAVARFFVEQMQIVRSEFGVIILAVKGVNKKRVVITVHCSYYRKKFCFKLCHIRKRQ